MSRPTRDDVAREAGVSSATVSRVYNKPDSVSSEKAKRVLTAARNLGYEPNRQASSLRRRGSGTITLVAIRKKNRPFYWGNQPLLKWMYADVIRSVLDETSKSMFQLQIQTIESRENLSLLRQTDGIIGYDVDTEEEVEWLTTMGKPLVICHHTEELKGLPSVSTDNKSGGRIQAEWLKRQGVSSPLYITGRTDRVPADRRRMEGFLETYGSDNVILIDNLTGLEEGEKRADEIHNIIRQRGADGIACVNDLTLLGIMTGGKGFFPADLPMIGYDNLPVLPLFKNFQATIDLRLNKIYRTATSRVLSILAGSGKTDRQESMIIQPELRES